MFTKTWKEVKSLIIKPKQELIEQYEKDFNYTDDSILTFGMDEADWDNMFMLTESGGLVAVGKVITLTEAAKEGWATLPEISLDAKPAKSWSEYVEEDVAAKDIPSKPDNSGKRLMNTDEYAALIGWKNE
jgi:hypothetical protein